MKKFFSICLFIIFMYNISFSQALSGNYYIPQGANPQGYASLAAAITDLNTNGCSGTVNFLIDADLNETGANLVITRADLNSTNNLVIKPAATKQPTITITGCTATAGASQYAGFTISDANYITIDGSNNGTNSRDLTIKMNDASNGRLAINLFGNCDNITIKNCNVTWQAMTTSTVSTAVYANGQTSGACDNLLISNNNFYTTSTAEPYYSVRITGSSGDNLYCTSVVVANNICAGQIRPIYFFYVGADAGTSEISGNQITAGSNNILDLYTYGILLNAYKGRINIYKNKIVTLKTNNQSSSGGLLGISTLSNQQQNSDTLFIVNNSITDFQCLNPTSNLSVVAGIYLQDSVKTKIYHNSINVSPVNYTTGNVSGIRVGPVAASVTLINNSIVNTHNDTSAYGIYYTGLGTLTSNYNNIYVTGANARIGYFGGVAQATLSNWKTASSQDANSISSDPLYAAVTNLSIGAFSPLINTGINVGITTDIDGNPRPEPSGTLYDIGAYEYQSLPAPATPVATAATSVSYTSFTANWNTAAYATSYYLDVAIDNSFTNYVSGYQNKNVGNVLTSPVTGLAVNTPYYYRVRAYNGLTSGNSNTITVTTLALPTYSGNYYIGAPGTGPGGSDPQYASLRAACQALNNGNVIGHCVFYITSNITETAAGIGLAINPDPYTVTFKPYTGVQPTITLQYTSDANSGPSGAFVIGIPMENNIAWNDLRITKNIIFDGSNTVGGTTRDLTITNLTNSHGNAFPITIVGDVSNVVIKNCNVYYKAQSTSTSNLFRATIQLRGRLNNSINWTPSNITLENNHISANFAGVSRGVIGVVITALSPTPATYSNNIIIRNNLIEGKQRTIALAWSANTDIYANEIILNQNIDGTVANQAIIAANVSASSTVNIYNNKVKTISSISNGASAGIVGISIETGGTYNVYNNMLFGFNVTATNPTAFIRGIAVTANATSNIFHNTIYMDNIASIGSGTVAYNGFYMNNGTNVFKNNIIISAETDFTSYCINRTGTAGTLTSDFNNLYPENIANGYVGFWNTAAAQTLAAWKTASSQDANSNSVAASFNLPTDLHLSGGSIGDGNLACKPIISITTDIDGHTRNLYWPYMGADEVVASPLALKLTLKALIEGFWKYDSTMVQDTLEVSLGHPTLYSKSASFKGLSSLSGFDFYLPKGTQSSYYVVVNHINTLETWSGSAITFPSGEASYNFTDAQSKAYGSVQKNVGGRWCFINGDTNQDQYIDGSDYLAIVNFWEAGDPRMPGDTNGDVYIDGSDYLQIVNNWEVGSITPLTLKKVTKPLKQAELRSTTTDQ